MNVWRLEYARNGRGIYCGYNGGASDAAGLTIVTVHARHPGPNTDPGIMEVWRYMSYREAKEYLFGFATLHQYREWCSRTVRRKLREYRVNDDRVVLTRLRVPKRAVLRGQRQVAFRKDAAERVEMRVP